MCDCLLLWSHVPVFRDVCTLCARLHGTDILLLIVYCFIWERNKNQVAALPRTRDMWCMVLKTVLFSLVLWCDAIVPSSSDMTPICTNVQVFFQVFVFVFLLSTLCGSLLHVCIFLYSFTGLVEGATAYFKEGRSRDVLWASCLKEGRWQRFQSCRCGLADSGLEGPWSYCVCRIQKVWGNKVKYINELNSSYCQPSNSRRH